VDLFGATDPAIAGHGEFISHLIGKLTGVAPVERDVRFSSSPHQDDTWSVVAAINSGVSTGQVGVVNLSMGTYPCAVEVEGKEIFSPPDLLLDELTRLRDQFDVRFVAAAGNDGHEPTDPLFYPAGYAGEAGTEDFVTSVGALGWSPEVDRWYAADFTNIFDFNVWAPGVAVVSEIDGSAYAWSGTSFAAPHVSACVAGGQC
jgi:subtilisin family serine protease